MDGIFSVPEFYEAAEEIPIFSFSVTPRSSACRSGTWAVVTLATLTMASKKNAKVHAKPKGACAYLFVYVCARGGLCVDACSLQLQPRPCEVIGMKLLFHPGARLLSSLGLSAFVMLVGGFLVVVVLQMGFLQFIAFNLTRTGVAQLRQCLTYTSKCGKVHCVPCRNLGDSSD